ncbi:MAG: hypothetical protein HY319_27635 [Armatimonadetes bacterium]|nr:hypothetical protein [Armatimonadota bacterium]
MNQIRSCLLYIVIFVYFVFEFWLDGILIGMFAKKPPEADTPDKAVYAVEVYKPSKVVEEAPPELIDETEGLYQYSWRLESKMESPEVIDFYQRTLEEPPDQEEEGAAYWEYKPAEARSEDELTTIAVGPGETGAVIEINQVVQSGIKLPGWKFRKWIIRLGMLGLLVLILNSRPILEMLGGMKVKKRMREGGTTYLRRAEGVPSSVATEAIWRHYASSLEDRGFTPLMDMSYDSLDGKRTNYLRAYQNMERMLTVYVHSIDLKTKTQAYIEVFSLFPDGSTAITSNTRHLGSGSRPEQHPLHEMPDGTPVHEVLGAHQAQLNRRGHPPVPLLPDRIPDVLRLLEQVVYAPGTTGAEQGLLDIARQSTEKGPAARAQAAAPEAAPPPPQPDEQQRFVNFVAGLITQQYPDWQLGRKSLFEIVVYRPSMDPEEVDLESLFYLCKRPNIDANTAIGNFVERLGA